MNSSTNKKENESKDFMQQTVESSEILATKERTEEELINKVSLKNREHEIKEEKEKINPFHN